jgi:hypothetical protein
MSVPPYIFMTSVTKGNLSLISASYICSLPCYDGSELSDIKIWSILCILRNNFTEGTQTGKGCRIHEMIAEYWVGDLA